jgi:hypothetical protein
MISTLADHGGDISWIGSLFIRYSCLVSLTDRGFDGMMIHAACADHLVMLLMMVVSCISSTKAWLEMWIYCIYQLSASRICHCMPFLDTTADLFQGIGCYSVRAS